jgi:CheY-like chemotaxis protein
MNRSGIVLISRTPHLLLVSYVKDERELYGGALHDAGFAVDAHHDPFDAFDAAVRCRPDVVVTRLLQPGFAETGIDLIRRLKQHPRTRHAIVIALTTMVLPEYRVGASRAGCDAVVLLPCLPDTLIDHICRSAVRRIA